LQGEDICNQGVVKEIHTTGATISSLAFDA